VQLGDLFVLPPQFALKLLVSGLQHGFVHAFDLERLHLFLLVLFHHLLLLLDLLDPVLEVFVLLRHAVQLGVEFERLFAEDDHLLLQVLDAVVGGKHLLLLLGLVLDFGQLLLDLGDVVAVGVQELGLMLLYHVLDLLVHVVDGLIEVSVGFVDGLDRFCGDELALWVHE
jgi:hypothetical protein